MVAMMTAIRLNSPRLAVKPASGRITSLGSGGKRFSSAIARPAPNTPSFSMMSTAHPATPVVGSPVAEFATIVADASMCTRYLFRVDDPVNVRVVDTTGNQTSGPS